MRCAALIDEDGPDDVRALIAEALAAQLAMGLGQVAEARAVLETALASISDPAARAVLEALEVALHPHSSATELDAPLASSAPDDDDTARFVTWLGTAHADLIAGRFESVATMAEEMRLRALRIRERRPEGLFWVTVLSWYALLMLGRFPEAERLGLDALEQSADHPYAWVRAWYIDMLGTLALVRGDAMAAARYLEEAAAVRREDDRGALAGSLLALTAARALLGDGDGAGAAYSEADGMSVSVLAPFVEVPLANGARLAAQGRVSSAREVAVAYAHECHANSFYFYELWAWRDAARYGAAAEAADGLEVMIDHVDPPLPAAFAAAARALAHRDPDALVAAASDLADLGLMLDAAELLATAARHAEARAAIAAARSAALPTSKCCGGRSRESRRRPCGRDRPSPRSPRGSSKSQPWPPTVSGTPTSPRPWSCRCGPFTPTCARCTPSSVSRVARTSPPRSPIGSRRVHDPRIGTGYR